MSSHFAGKINAGEQAKSIYFIYDKDNCGIIWSGTTKSGGKLCTLKRKFW